MHSVIMRKRIYQEVRLCAVIMGSVVFSFIVFTSSLLHADSLETNVIDGGGQKVTDATNSVYDSSGQGVSWESSDGTYKLRSGFIVSVPLPPSCGCASAGNCTVSGWSNNAAFTFRNNAGCAAPPCAFSNGATQYYRYLFNQSSTYTEVQIQAGSKWSDAALKCPGGICDKLGTSFNINATADGWWYFHARSYNGGIKGGPSAGGSYTLGPYGVDTTAPTVSYSSPAASSWQKQDFPINTSDIDPSPSSGLPTCQYKVESYNGAWVETKAWTARTCNSASSATITVLAATGDCRNEGTGDNGLGACKVSIRATDGVTNATTVVRQFKIDWTAPPNFTALGYEDSAKLNSLFSNDGYPYYVLGTKPYFEFPVTDAMSGTAKYWIYWGTNDATDPSTDNGAASTFTNNLTLTDATKYYMRIKAQDNAGNISNVTMFTYIYNANSPSWRYPGLGSNVGAFYGGGTIRAFGAEQRFYVISYAGIFYASDATTGTLKWSYDLTSPTNYGAVSSPPLVFNNKIYLGTEDGYVLRIVDNGASATVEATRDLGVCSIQSATLAISISGATKILAGCGANIWALNDDATFTNWAAWVTNPVALTGSVTRSIPALVSQAGGVDPWIYVATQNGTLVDSNYGVVYKIDVDNGVVASTFSDSTDFTGFLALRNHFNGGQWLYAGGVNSNKFYVIRTSSIPASCLAPNCYSYTEVGMTGFEGGAGVSSGGSAIYVGNNNGKLYRLNFDGSALTKAYDFNAGAAVKYGITFRQATGKLYFGATSGLFFVLTDSGASFTENMRYHTGSSVESTPAVNTTANKVLIPSTIGRIFSFGL